MSTGLSAHVGCLNRELFRFEQAVMAQRHASTDAFPSFACTKALGKIVKLLHQIRRRHPTELRQGLQLGADARLRGLGHRRLAGSRNIKDRESCNGIKAWELRHDHHLGQADPVRHPIEASIQDGRCHRLRAPKGPGCIDTTLASVEEGATLGELPEH